MKKKPREYCALALDNLGDRESLLKLAKQTAPYLGICKIGFEQFIRFGPSIIEQMRASETKIFLDLKLHDIPNTVAKAVGAACEHGVDFLTIHASGGMAMMRAAADAAREAELRGKKAPRLIGVTVLTSIGEEPLRSELNVSVSLEQQVRNLAGLAVEAGLDGIVCSAADLPAVKPLLPADFDVITPGIRMARGDTHDQARVATPEQAIRQGATVLVIGRAVTAAQEPAEAARQVHGAVAGALGS
jgi:orotidine-5'-phosphate decarboxylase